MPETRGCIEAAERKAYRAETVIGQADSADLRFYSFICSLLYMQPTLVIYNQHRNTPSSLDWTIDLPCKSIIFNGVKVNSVENTMPQSALTGVLLSAYPNAFNNRTTICFTLPRPGPVMLDVCDPLGRRVSDLIPVSWLPLGEHRIVLDADDLPNGSYMVQVMHPGGIASRMVALVK